MSDDDIHMRFCAEPGEATTADARSEAVRYLPYLDVTEDRIAGGKCRVYWGSHGCMLQRGHDGPHLCDCHTDPGPGNVGAPPYYGPETRFYGEDADQ